MASRPERHERHERHGGKPSRVARKLHYNNVGMPWEDPDSFTGPARGRSRRTRRVLVGGARQVVVVALLPLWPFVAYPLSLAVRAPHRARRTGRTRRRLLVPNPGRASMPSRMVHSVVRHPVVNALAAPMRFVASRTPFRAPTKAPRSAGDERGEGDWGPPSAGDREPRRPKPGSPVDAIALPEPRG